MFNATKERYKDLKRGIRIHSKLPNENSGFVELDLNWLKHLEKELNKMELNRR